MNHPFSVHDCSSLGPEAWLASAQRNAGRLDERTRRCVQAWLREHPEAAAALDDCDQFRRAAQISTVPEPTEAEWTLALARIERALTAYERSRARPVRRSWLVHAAAAAAAAALLIWTPGDSTFQPPQDRLAVTGAPIPLAEPHELEIVSIDAADLQRLVVGHGPLHGPLVLATVKEVELQYAEAGESGWVPGAPGGDEATPMYVVPPKSTADAP